MYTLYLCTKKELVQKEDSEYETQSVCSRYSLFQIIREAIKLEDKVVPLKTHFEIYKEFPKSLSREYIMDIWHSDFTEGEMFVPPVEDKFIKETREKT